MRLFPRHKLRNAGTSGRTDLNPAGNTDRGSVRLGNLLAHRCMLLMILAAARGIWFFLEQPSSSKLPLLPRWTEMLQYVKVADSACGADSCVICKMCCVKSLSLSFMRACETAAHKGLPNCILDGSIWFQNAEAHRGLEQQQKHPAAFQPGA